MIVSPICEMLGISKFTFYNYLEASRSDSVDE